MLEDKLLILRFKQGDCDALRQIYDKYKDDLLKLAIFLTGDICCSEDVVQDVFVKLAQSYDRIGIRSNLKNYLITCLINKIRTFRRDHKRHKEKERDQSTIRISQVSHPDHWAVLNEQMRQLSDAMTKLSFEQREVISLRFEVGLAFRQIAKIQNSPINTVVGRYRYGMDKLRSLMNSKVTK
jgi:RNA polymerase sigma-70 factor (ECF subfamily)